MEKLIFAAVSVVSAVIGGLYSYGTGVAELQGKMDGRLTAIEKTLTRIESQIYRVPTEKDK